MTRVAFVAALAVLATVTGCVGTETGNPPLRAPGGFVGTYPMGIRPIPIDSASVVVGAIGFVPAGECPDGEARAAVSGPVEVDLVPAAGEGLELSLAAGDYCAARIDLASLSIEGMASDGTRFVAHVAPPETIVLDATAGSFAYREGEAATLFAIDWTLVLAGVDPASGAREADGSVRIDAGHNAALAAAIAVNLPGAIVLRRDADADGTLDDDEAIAEPLAAAGVAVGL